MRLLKFEDLKHEPFVDVPDSIDGITEEWFAKQKERIEKKIAQYEQSNIPRDSKQRTVRKLQERIKRLRAFTDEVLKSETAESPEPVEQLPRQSIDYEEYYNSARRYDEFVDSLIKQKEKQESLNLYLQPFIKK